AVYQPGEIVTFTISALPANSRARYRHLDEVIKDEALNSTTWNWQPPATDLKGYLVEIYTKNDDKEKVIAAIAVDVSSNTLHFPRNGFLSTYGPLSTDHLKSVMSNLNRHHINVVQFQDWEHKHHLPLPGTVSKPLDNWKDIGNRDNTRSTVQQYIELAHGY